MFYTQRLKIVISKVNNRIYTDYRYFQNIFYNLPCLQCDYTIIKCTKNINPFTTETFLDVVLNAIFWRMYNMYVGVICFEMSIMGNGQF